MRKQSIAIAATIIFILALATLAMAAEPFAGTWKLNVAKSQYNSGRPDKSSTVTFAAQENGLKLVADGVDADGKTSHVTWNAKFDGKDYPVTGTEDVDTIAITRPDANSYSELFKKAGKEIASTRSVLSKDGKTITRTFKGKDAKGQEVVNIYIMEKQ
jgi:hypothetical protein